MGLLVLNRPGIQVVYGQVAAYDNSSITLENNKRYCMLHVKDGTISKMHISLGVNIMATIKPTQESIELAKQPSKDYVFFETEAYNLRYTGAFDFEAYGAEKETHIFCGNVMNVVPLKTGHLATISWKQKSEFVKKQIFMTKDLIGKKNRGVFVVGAPTLGKMESIFPLLRVEN